MNHLILFGFQYVPNFRKQLFLPVYLNFFLSFLPFDNPAHQADDEIDSQGNNQEIDDGLDKIAVIPGGSVNQFDFQAAEINSAQNYPQRRHQDIIHKRIDHLAKRQTDGDANNHIHQIAAHGKFLKIFNKFFHRVIFTSDDTAFILNYFNLKNNPDNS